MPNAGQRLGKTFNIYNIMDTELNPNKFEEMVTPLYAQIKEIKSQINAIGLQAKDECYEILSKNPKGNCILINPDSEDLVLNQENYAIWAIAAFDGTIHVKAYTEYNVPAPDDKFQSAYYKNASGRDVCPFYAETFVYIYQSVLKNLDKAMPLEEAEQYYPQWSHEDQEWQMVKK